MELFWIFTSNSFLHFMVGSIVCIIVSHAVMRRVSHSPLPGASQAI